MELTFRAMGSDCHIAVVGADGALLARRAQARIDHLESLWSRFRPDSEISRLNDAAGQPMRVGAETVLLVERAIEAWRLSAGMFDPTMLGALIRAGYARSFESLGPTPPAGSSPLGRGVEHIHIDDDTVTLPAGIGFDPGGIGKGLAADLVADEIMRCDALGVCINLGGDVRVSGVAPDGGPWTIAIEHERSPEPIATVGLSDGAVATSTTLRRTWQTDGQVRHHLIDPHTGLPSDTDVDLAAVVCGEAWCAEVLAKAVLLHGAAHPFDILGGTGAEAIATDTEGRIHATPGFAAYLGGAALATHI